MKLRAISMAAVAFVLVAGCAKQQQPATAQPAGPAAASGPPSSTPATAPAGTKECPANVQSMATSQGGACLEAAVLGEDVVAACTTWFASMGWVRDGDAEAAIGGQTGKTLVCHHAP